MRTMKHTVRALLIALFLLPLHTLTAAASEGVEYSYHGQMGLGTDLGMLEKWCALPNFSFHEEDGIDGWTKKDCNNCHIGAAWNPTKPEAQCVRCHASETEDPAAHNVGMDRCMGCHKKDTAKRGDMFTAEQDVHIAMGMVCQDCHLRVDDGFSDHQFLKGTAMDTTEATMEGTLSCTSSCHENKPHDKSAKKGRALNKHTRKVACETCHTGLRPAPALASRTWNVFNADGKPITVKRDAGWLPEHKWYDNTGPGATGDYHLPILYHTERRDVPKAKIYPFNPVTVDWYVKDEESGFDDVIIVSEVKAADGILDDIKDGTITLEEMQAVYPEARLLQADMNFSINHSVTPKELSFDCNDCHGRNGWVLDWKELGYTGDPRMKSGKGHKNK